MVNCQTPHLKAHNQKSAPTEADAQKTQTPIVAKQTESDRQGLFALCIHNHKQNNEVCIFIKPVYL